MSVAHNQVLPIRPDPTTPDQRALGDFWKIYDAHYDEITAGTTTALADDPEIATVLRAVPPEQLEQGQRKSRELMRRAIVEGDFEPYVADLRVQGAAYARMGLSFTGWFKAVGAFRALLVPRLLEGYGATPQRLLAAVEAMTAFLDRAMAAIGEEYLATKEKLILQQQEALRELSTPVLQVRDKMLLLPIVGVVDSHRAQQLTEHLLRAIRDNRARVVVLDITGVPAVDTKVANHLVQTVEAARLMGASAIVTGLSAEVAQTLVTLGIELGKLNTIGDLQGGLEAADRLLSDRMAFTTHPNGELKLAE